MKETIRQYIRNYHLCRYTKAPKNWYNDLLKPLSIHVRLLTDVTLDFVTCLPLSNGYNAILIIVDCLTKEKYYILSTTDDNSTSTEATIKLLLNHIKNFIASLCHLF